jgi:hypothetical protein
MVTTNILQLEREERKINATMEDNDGDKQEKSEGVSPPSDFKTMMLPESELLSRVGAFLPQIQAANQGTYCRWQFWLLSFRSYKF